MFLRNFELHERWGGCSIVGRNPGFNDGVSIENKRENGKNLSWKDSTHSTSQSCYQRCCSIRCFVDAWVHSKGNSLFTIWLSSHRQNSTETSRASIRWPQNFHKTKLRKEQKPPILTTINQNFFENNFQYRLIIHCLFLSVCSFKKDYAVCRLVALRSHCRTTTWCHKKRWFSEKKSGDLNVQCFLFVTKIFYIPTDENTAHRVFGCTGAFMVEIACRIVRRHRIPQSAGQGTDFTRIFNDDVFPHFCFVGVKS